MECHTRCVPALWCAVSERTATTRWLAPAEQLVPAVSTACRLWGGRPRAPTRGQQLL